MNNRFLVPRFEIAEFLMQSSSYPKPKPGESSSSNLLNRYFEAVSADMNLQYTRTSKLASRCSSILTAMAVQSTALLAAFQEVSTKVDAASGYDKILADLYSQTYVDTGSTSANINYNYGQATLPVKSTNDLIRFVDVYGNVSISPEVELTYSLEDPPEDYLVVNGFEYMLAGKHPVLITELSSGDVCYTVLKAPLQFRGLTPNVLELLPIPAFGLDLMSVQYLESGDSYTGNWEDADITYLPRYDTVNDFVPAVTPVRIHLPNVGISAIRIKMRARSDTVFGWYSIRVFHTEYENSGVLVLEDPYSRTISKPLLRGRDQAALSLLNVALNANQATVTLTTTDSSTTPVITGMVLDV